jgi:hypothetical protein
VGCLAVLGMAAAAPAQQAAGQQQEPPKAPPTPRTFGSVPPPTAPARVEKLGDKLMRIGNVRVDLAKKEVSVAGTINSVPLLEFIVNTKGGFKNYESAIEAETNAIDFNLGLILIGLERNRALVPRFHFDPIAPQGDPVEVWVSWKEGTKERRIPAEELVYDSGSMKTLPKAAWVYTGSQFMPNSSAFLADRDGVLIGFVHTPEPLIENANPVPGPYGAIKLNPNLSLKPGSPVTLTVRALPLPGK